MDINDVFNRETSIKKCDAATCPICGNIIDVYRKDIPGNAVRHCSVEYFTKCKCGFSAINLSKHDLYVNLQKLQKERANYKITESFWRMTSLSGWEETKIVIDTAKTYDEAIEKIKKYKEACGENRILSIELISKDLQE